MKNEEIEPADHRRTQLFAGRLSKSREAALEIGIDDEP
jgi:hypothetical protein